MIALFAPPASASLPASGVGPADPNSATAIGHFPAFYTDGTGLALQPCLDGLPLCLTAAADFVNPTGEAFYYAASADVGPITVDNRLEAAFLAAGADQEITFMRTLVSAPKGGLTPNATYTITDPYGTVTCTADSTGVIPKAGNTGCRFQTPAAGVPLDFQAATAGRIGPFLVWDSFVDPTLGTPPPAGYIGDNATPHTVVGSPNNYNKVAVQGPGFTGTCTLPDGSTVGSCQETDLFIVQGKVQPSVSASVSPQAWDAGNVATTAPVTQRFTYTSTGAAGAAVVSGVTVSAGDFALTAETCTTATQPDGTPGLAKGQTCTIDVTFTPQAGLASTGTLTIADNTTGSPRTIPLKGSNLAVMTVDLTSLAFGNQKTTTTSPPQIVTVGNAGNAPLTATTAISGLHASMFQVVSNGCTTPLAPGNGCEIGVTFTPTSTGNKQATLTISGGGASTTVALTGTGTTPVVTPSVTSLAFGDQTAGTTSAAQGVTLRNGGTTAWTIDTLGITGADANQFSSLSPATNPCSVGSVVAAGATCTTQVTFAPTSAGTKTASLSITADGQSVGVALSGNGVGAQTPPTAPTGVTATAGNASATVQWVVPASDGGSPIAGYTVRTFNSATGAQVGTPLTVGNVLVASVTGLTNGTAYVFDVAARNAIGTGAFSARSAAVTPTGGTAPTLSARAPAVNATSVGVAANITATFGVQVTGVDRTTFAIRPAATPTAAPIAGTVTQNATNLRQWILNPTANLSPDTQYTVTLTGGATAIRDLAGNAFASLSWSFTTGPAPKVSARTPAAGATGVSRTANVTATFSEAVQGVSQGTFTLNNAVTGAAIIAGVSRNGTTNQWVLDPSVPLAANTRFTVTLTGGATAIRDLAGNPLAKTTWNFTTGP